MGPGNELSQAEQAQPTATLHIPIAHQRQLRICTGVHPKLEITGTEAQHGTALPGQDGGADEGISQARPWWHRHQVGASAILAV